MLTKSELEKIRELLDSSQNPLFFFDNDSDGLSSFLLLQKYLGRGKGVAIKSFPDLNASYIRKLHELKPDKVFVLDKPLIADEFIEAAEQYGMPVVWIDHHPLQEKRKNVEYFNPLKNKPSSNEPTSYWCYAVANQKENMWIAMVGCIGDWFLPDFAKEFSENYPDLLPKKSLEPSKALYETPIGKIATLLSFALKDKTSNIVSMLKILIEMKNPYELIEENEKTKRMFKRYKEISNKYGKLIEKAKAQTEKSKILFFKYGGDLSISGELANELLYHFQDKIIAVAFIKGNEVKLSFRGKNVRNVVEKAMEGINGSSGGHADACAGRMPLDELEKFKRNLLQEVGEK